MVNPPSIGPVNPDYRYASDQAVDAWHDLKFGLRIHWGECKLFRILQQGFVLTSSCADAIDGLGPESWPLNRARNITFLKWYWDQYKTWNPVKYDADQWISMMNSAVCVPSIVEQVWPWPKQRGLAESATAE